ncbi:unnamed protein product [Rotaria sp. Silwood1]|nr:unnamed protein product [Rotaria sp. Silwood1]
MSDTCTSRVRQSALMQFSNLLIGSFQTQLVTTNAIVPGFPIAGVHNLCMDKTQTTLDKIWNKSQGATSTRHISSLVDHEIEMILTVSSSSSTASSSATNPLSSCTNSPSSSTTIPSSSSMTSSSSATNLFSSCNNSPSSSTTTPSSSSSSIISLPSSPILTAETENALTENINKNSSNKPIRLLSNDCTLLTGNKDVEKKDSKSIRTKHRVQYLPNWEKYPESKYKTFF